MPRGIDSDIPAPEGAGGGRGRFIRRIILRNAGEFATVRFLTEGDEAYSNRFHSVENDGKGPKWVNKICVKAEFGQACKHCEQDNPLTHYLFWVYQTKHYYPEEPTRITVKRAKMNGKTVYVQDVNEVRLLQVTFSHRDSILTRWERRGTLLDREFDWIRGGKKGAPSYTLEALDKSPMSKELKAMIETLPDLEDVALGKVEKLGGDDEEDDGEEGGRKRYGTRRVSEDGDDKEGSGNEFGRGRAADDSEEDEEDDEEEKPKAEAAAKRRAKPEPEEGEKEGEDDDDDDEDPFA